MKIGIFKTKKTDMLLLECIERTKKRKGNPNLKNEPDILFGSNVVGENKYISMIIATDLTVYSQAPRASVVGLATSIIL